MICKTRIIALLAAMSLTSSAFAMNFADLRQDYWAYNPIQTLSQENIISGYSDNTFRPDNQVSRAEFATMIIKAMDKGNMQVSYPHSFYDLSGSFWAYNDIQRAFALGLIKGLPDGSFKPNSYITRTEVMAILSSAAQAGFMSDMEANQILNKFYDAGRVPAWAKVSVAKTVKANLNVNYPQPNFLMPDKKATRAEVAAMLLNLRKELGLEQMQPQTSQNYNQLVQPMNQPNTQQQYQQPAIVDQIQQQAAGGAATNVILRGSVATIQENSVIPTVLETPLNSEMAKAGDPVYLKVSSNVTTSQGVLLIPAGSKVEGKILTVIPAKAGNRNASMNINFNTIVTPNGHRFPLEASVATDTGMLEAGSLKASLGKAAVRTAIGAGSGAVLGTALGGITGKTGKGAIYGTAIGGGLGLVGSILAQGGAIQVPSGEALFIKLTNPLYVDVNTGNIINR